jgi:TPR repeat protein
MSEDRIGLMDVVIAADNGDIGAMDDFIATVLGSEDLYENPGIAEKVDDYVRKLASSGRPEGLIYIGDSYIRGNVEDKDLEKAFEYFELAAEAGETFGYEIMAELLIKGNDLPVDYGKAYGYMKKSEDANDGKLRSDSGNYYMGEMYYFGLGVSKDWRKARKYYRRNIENHSYRGSDYYWKSCARLASIYENEGKESYRKAIDQMKRVVKKHTAGMSDDEVAETLGEY